MIQQQIMQQVIQQPASEAGEVKVMLKEMMSKIEMLEDNVNRLLKEKLGVREVEMVDMGVDRRRVGKMEVEQGKWDEQEQGAAQLTLEEAGEGGFVVKGRVDRWLGDRGFGFVKVKGKSVFCRTERVVGKKSMEMGEVAWVKVMRDWSREDESWKAEEAWTDEGWEGEVKRRKGREALELAGRAAQVVATSVEKGLQMLDGSPGSPYAAPMATMAAAPVSHGGGFAAPVSKLGRGFSVPMTPREEYKQRILAMYKQYKVQQIYIDKVHRGMDKADTDPRKFYEIVC